MVLLDLLHITCLCAYIAIMFVVLSTMQEDEGYEEDE